MPAIVPAPGIGRRHVKPKYGTTVCMCGAFCVALATAVILVAAFGTDERGTRVALRATARWSFLLFWPAYAGGALATLFGPRFAVLARRRREFGLAFASAHLVHLALIICLFRILGRPPGSDRSTVFFAIGMTWVYILALSSVARVDNALGPGLTRILRFVGIEYIALAFFVDLVVHPIQSVTYPMQYLPFTILSIAGPLLRVAALARRSLGRQHGKHLIPQLRNTP
jgi:hypothetical protein